MPQNVCRFCSKTRDPEKPAIAVTISFKERSIPFLIPVCCDCLNLVRNNPQNGIKAKQSVVYCRMCSNFELEPIEKHYNKLVVTVERCEICKHLPSDYLSGLVPDNIEIE